MAAGKQVSNAVGRLRRHALECKELREGGLTGGRNQAKLDFKKDKVQQRLVDQLVARFVYSSNLPFRIVVSNGFKNLVHNLSPGMGFLFIHHHHHQNHYWFIRIRLATKLLDDEVDVIMEEDL